MLNISNNKQKRNKNLRINKQTDRERKYIELLE